MTGKKVGNLALNIKHDSQPADQDDVIFSGINYSSQRHLNLGSGLFYHTDADIFLGNHLANLLNTLKQLTLIASKLFVQSSVWQIWLIY